MGHELPQLEIIACCAAHDERDRACNHSLSFCTNNAICSHGNAILDATIESGVKTGKIPPERALVLNQTLADTRIELARWTDCMAVMKRHLRIGKYDEENLRRIEAFLVSALGEDRTQWDAVHAREQLRISQPIRDLIEELETLGLLTCDQEPKFVDTRALIIQTGDEQYLSKIPAM